MKSDTVLIIVDMQNDFVRPNGSLAVKDAELIISEIIKIEHLFSRIMMKELGIFMA